MMKRNSKKQYGIILFLVLTVWVQAQDRQNLVDIKKEIQKLESQLKEKEKRERSILEQVEDLDRKTGLQKKLVRKLEQEKIMNLQAIQRIEIQLKRAFEDYGKLKEIVAERLVFLYKRGRMKDWEALLMLSSPSQAMVWVQYQKRIMDNDLRNLKLLMEKENEIRQQMNNRKREVQRQTRLIAENKEETKNLEQTKSARNRLLITVRREKTPLQEQLRLKRMAYRQIENLINKQEVKRKTTVSKWDGTQFAKRKGKLDWPVQGKIVTTFGRHRDPVLKTVIPDVGIKIKTGEGEEVRSVFEGEVTIVTWMRGVGNMVLVNHGGGYYTVYGHLDEVYVNPGDEIDRGMILGQVGEYDGLYQSELNFGIWTPPGPNPVNPVHWLKKG